MAASARAMLRSERQLHTLVNRYLLKAACVIAPLYIAYYYPHAQNSVADRVVSAYLQRLAAVAGWLISLFDASAHSVGTLILGRFPLRLIKDCSAIDAQVLLLAAIVAFPSRVSSRFFGAAAGLLLLNALNSCRVVGLYFVGMYAPTRFDQIHEELMPLGLVLGAALWFLIWVNRVRRLEGQARA